MLCQPGGMIAVRAFSQTVLKLNTIQQGSRQVIYGVFGEAARYWDAVIATLIDMNIHWQEE